MKKGILLLVGLLFVTCVMAESYNHTIILKTKAYSEIEVSCNEGDEIEIDARSADGSYFYVEIFNPFEQKVFREGDDEEIEADYRIPVSGIYTIRIANYARFEDVTVDYTITRGYTKLLFLERSQDIILPRSRM